MQFRYLTFSALGPFPGTHTIDFDELTAGGLFLFDGPTGSGKSSIIDAIVFALYGNVAGRESDDARIRSAYANDTTPSYSDLVFTIPSGIYRVRRSPAWNRKKKRGTGTTTVPSTATLWRLSEAAVDAHEWDAGDVLASGSRDVGEELSQLLALNREQFVQTVVLPQGQFAEFLRMSSIQRSALLETLFDTGDYREFAKALMLTAQTARDNVDGTGAKATRALQAWCDIDGLNSEFPETTSLEFIDAYDSAPLEAMEVVHDQLRTHEIESRTRADERKVAREAAVKKRLAEEDLAKALADLSALLNTRKALDAQKDDVANMSKKIALHDTVATAVDRLATAKRAQTALESASAKLPDGLAPVSRERSDLAEKITAGVDLAPAADQLVIAVDAAINELAGTVGGLETLVALEVGLTGRGRDLEKLEESAGLLAEEIGNLSSEIDAFPAKLESIESDISKAREEAATIPSLEAHHGKLEEQLKQVEQLAALRTDLDKASDEVATALNRHKEQLDEVNSVTAAWRRSAAANLASDLTEDGPCPVCGSLEHPAPAQASDDSASLEDVAVAEEALKPLAVALDRANATRATIKGREETLAAQVGDVSAEQVAKSIEIVTSALALAQNAETSEKTLTDSRKDLVEKNAVREKERGVKREEHSTLMERIKNAREALSSDEAAVAKARGKHASVVALRDSLLAQRLDLTDLKASAETIAERARQANDAYLVAFDALDAAGVTEDEARAAHLEPEILADLKATVEQYVKDTAAVQAQLASERFEGLTADVKPDVNEARRQEAEAETAYREASAEHTLAKSRATSSERLLERTRQAVVRWKKATDDAGPVARLAALANAENTSLSKIRLSTWVLLRRFEQIVDRANEHLREFSFGRYELIRSDEPGAERKTGLGLEVIHHDAGPQGDHRRSPGTLSGGETFYTSLALALALSEVVQAENGGIRMETLIIDEGFGSLSSAYLQSIMDTLGQLRTGGRTVGIVSHVDDLKSMISDRVTVRPLDGGGSTLSVVAGN